MESGRYKREGGREEREGGGEERELDEEREHSREERLGDSEERDERARERRERAVTKEREPMGGRTFNDVAVWVLLTLAAALSARSTRGDRSFCCGCLLCGVAFGAVDMATVRSGMAWVAKRAKDLAFSSGCLWMSTGGPGRVSVWCWSDPALAFRSSQIRPRVGQI